MKRYIPQFIGAGLVAISAIWIFASDREPKSIVIPAVLLIVGLGLLYFQQFFGPPLLTDPLASIDPEPCRTTPAANAQEAQAYQEWVRQALASTTPAAQTMAMTPTMSSVPDMSMTQSVMPAQLTTTASATGTPIPAPAPAPTPAPAPAPAPAPQQAPAAASEDDELDLTRAAQPTTHEFTVSDATNPQTPWDVQAEIAQTRPDLWAALATNPSVYPDLKAWLDRHINK